MLSGILRLKSFTNHIENRGVSGDLLPKPEIFCFGRPSTTLGTGKSPETPKTFCLRLCRFGMVGILFTLGLPSWGGGLSVEESVRIGVEGNPGVRIAAENIRRNAADVDEASAAGFPRLTLDANASRTDREPTFQLVPGVDTVLAPKGTQSASLTLSQSLDAFGSIDVGRRMAGLSKSLERFEYDRVRNDLALEIKQSFYNVLRAQAYVGVQRDIVKQLEAHVVDAQANLKAGTVPRYELLRAETEVANARVNLISVENALKLAKASFNNSLGRDLNTEVDLDEPPVAEFPSIDLPAYTDAACRLRPEVLSANASLELARMMVVIAKRQANPKLDFAMTEERNFTPTFTDPLSSSWRASITSSLAIYDGGAVRAGVRKAGSDVVSAESGKKLAMLGIALDARQAFLNVKEAKERMESAARTLDLAREGMRLANSRYKAGLSTQVEVLDTRTALSQAEMNGVNARYDYQSAMAKLEQAVGGQGAFLQVIGRKGGDSKAK